MKKVIVFDLDDTLYNEYDYVKSGFNAVSQLLTSRYDCLDCEELNTWMWKREQTVGRGAIFDDLLKVYQIFSTDLVEECVKAYRIHFPKITLPQDSIYILKFLKDFPLYLVTDGHPSVQENKIKALELEKYMTKCIPSYRVNVKYGKPSPFYFNEIVEWEQVQPNDVVYIGDNPQKDFVGIKPIGFRTIRIMQGQHAKIELEKKYEAEYRISDISELPLVLKKVWPEIEVL